MTTVPVCAIALLLLAAEDPAAGPIEKYLQRCELAKAVSIEAVGKEIKALEAVREPTSEQQKRLQAVRAEQLQLQKPSTPQLALPLPPAKDDVGVFAPVDPRMGRSVDVLDVVDQDDVIVRAWYWSTKPLPQDPMADADATFVDLWIHGIDTSRLTARDPAQLPQVFHVTGNELFDTTCGKRSMPRLEPVDLAPFVRAKSK